MNAEDFNSKFPIGTNILYFSTKGSLKYRNAKTRSSAWELGHGAAVVQITGQSGSVSVGHVTKALP